MSLVWVYDTDWDTWIQVPAGTEDPTIGEDDFDEDDADYPESDFDDDADDEDYQGHDGEASDSDDESEEEWPELEIDIEDETGEGSGYSPQPVWIDVLPEGDDPGWSVRVSDKGDRIVQRFDTAKAYLDYITSPVDSTMIPDHDLKYRYSRKKYHQDESLGLTFEQAVELARSGWHDGVDRADKLAQKVHRILSGAIPLPEIRYDVQGEMLDVARWVNGEPEDFMLMVDSAVNVDARPPKVIRIVTTVDIASTEGFITRGAAVAALTQTLELHGVRVQVDCHIGSNRLVDTWVRVKEAEWPVDMEKLVFFTAHPSMFWLFSYAAWEHLPEDWRNRMGKLGTHSMGYISEPPMDERGDIYISALGTAWLGEAMVLEWVKRELNLHGIEVQ